MLSGMATQKAKQIIWKLLMRMAGNNRQVSDDTGVHLLIRKSGKSNPLK